MNDIATPTPEETPTEAVVYAAPMEQNPVQETEYDPEILALIERYQSMEKAQFLQSSERYEKQLAKMKSAAVAPPFPRSLSWVSILGAFTNMSVIEYQSVRHHFLGDYYLLSARTPELARLERIRERRAGHGQPGHVHTDACRHKH